MKWTKENLLSILMEGCGQSGENLETWLQQYISNFTEKLGDCELAVLGNAKGGLLASSTALLDENDQQPSWTKAFFENVFQETAENIASENFAPLIPEQAQKLLKDYLLYIFELEYDQSSIGRVLLFSRNQFDIHTHFLLRAVLTPIASHIHFYGVIAANNDLIAELDQQTLAILADQEDLLGLSEKLRAQQEEIQIQNEEIQVQNENIQYQNRMLEQQSQKLNDSLSYAKTIQNAVLDEPEQIKQVFPDSFIVFYPKDIVSGDGYLFDRIADTRILAQYDCTGHGVPGAFMSIVTHSILSEIILNSTKFDGADVLNKLHKEIYRRLRQESGSNKDGMDIAICFMNKVDGKWLINFSGAKRPFVFKRKNEAHLSEIQGSRRGIGGGYEKSVYTFQSTELVLEPGDSIFLYSDGMTDNCNAMREKYGIQRLKDFIMKHHESPFVQFKQAMKAEFDEFLEYSEQRDDMSFIAVRLD